MSLNIIETWNLLIKYTRIVETFLHSLCSTLSNHLLDQISHVNSFILKLIITTSPYIDKMSESKTSIFSHDFLISGLQNNEFRYVYLRNV